MSLELEKSIFCHALDISSSQERDEYLENACQGDEKLLAAVCALLRENERDTNPVDKPLAAFFPTMHYFDSDQADQTPFNPDTMVGPYKLREQIGEGGFGLVFVADQVTPVQRRVALKIIKPGLGSRELLARFEAERQALAMMDHENIARVFDAGVTDTNQPYFVMELVRGIPLNEFCDRHRLNTQERLELFLSICSAVQHAHQKGIIHRDLKPSNVLVSLQDGRPNPKVIDFGLVKAIGQSLTEKTIYTRFAAMIGTPAYMSPEQAEMSNEDIDTRSDIYSLGVLLYEILTGSTPFTVDQLNEVAFDELRRIIREDEPPRPSARFSTLRADVATTVSQNRRLAPGQLNSLMKGDLDWIVMKALDKDRNRRYSSAEALALDIKRFLNEKPVEARPPSSFYRFTKFARRNKVVLTTASLVAAAMVLGSAISIWQAGVAYQALELARVAEEEANHSRAELEQFADHLKKANRLLSSGRAYAESGNWPDAHRAYTRATKVQPRYFHVWMERGSLYAKLGLWDRAAADYAKALEMGCPVDGVDFLGVPQLFYYTQNKATYQQVVRALMATSGSVNSTKIRGLLVGELSDEMAKQLAREGESLIETQFFPPSGRRTRNSRMPLGAKLYIAGWAHLRADHLTRAIKRLEESHTDDPDWRGHGTSYPLLAIAYYRAGRFVDAKKTLGQADQTLDSWLNQSIEKLQGAPPIPWFDWVEFLINHRKAYLLIQGKEPPSDPRLADRMLRARAAIK